jgi:hypothetical protein
MESRALLQTIVDPKISHLGQKWQALPAEHFRDLPCVLLRTAHRQLRAAPLHIIQVGVDRIVMAGHAVCRLWYFCM